MTTRNTSFDGRYKEYGPEFLSRIGRLGWIARYHPEQLEAEQGAYRRWKEGVMIKLGLWMPIED